VVASVTVPLLTHARLPLRFGVLEEIMVAPAVASVPGPLIWPLSGLTAPVVVSVLPAPSRR
jgi:hypothetical protein